MEVVWQRCHKMFTYAVFFICKRIFTGKKTSTAFSVRDSITRWIFCSLFVWVLKVFTTFGCLGEIEIEISARFYEITYILILKIHPATLIKNLDPAFSACVWLLKLFWKPPAILKIVSKAGNHMFMFTGEIYQWQRRNAETEILMQLSEIFLELITLSDFKKPSRN